MRFCIAALILLALAGCDYTLARERPSVTQRVTVLEEQGFGTHTVKLVRIDDKEYILNGDGGIIEHHR